jgi:hypothetical protein
MLYSVNGSVGFNGYSFEPYPNKNGATNVISDNSVFSALISFVANQWWMVPPVKSSRVQPTQPK